MFGAVEGDRVFAFQAHLHVARGGKTAQQHAGGDENPLEHELLNIGGGVRHHHAVGGFLARDAELRDAAVGDVYTHRGNIAEQLDMLRFAGA